MANGNGNGNGLAKFSPGQVAEVIALAGCGEEVPSLKPGWKAQVKYRLADGRTWYAPLTVRAKIANLGLAEGEPFRVCLRSYGSAGQSVIDVMRCNSSQMRAHDRTPAELAAGRVDSWRANVEAAVAALEAALRCGA